MQGYLLHKRMIDFDLADISPVSTTWRKIKPVVEGFREQHNVPRIGEWFEYLYNELQKQSQRLQQTQQ